MTQNIIFIKNIFFSDFSLQFKIYYKNFKLIYIHLESYSYFPGFSLGFL